MPGKTITSLHNPRVNQAVRLRNARHRAKERRILIDGAREILQALRAGIEPVELFVCDSLCASPEAREVLARAERLRGDVWHVSPEVFEKLAFGARHEGVLAVAETPRRSLAEWNVAPGLVAVLEGLEKPGNVGAVIRSADGAGVAGVIVADPRTDLFNPNCIRASLGTVFTRPVCTASSAETLAWLRGRGAKIYAARVDAEMSYTAAELATNAAVVLGSEAAGLSDVWRAPDVIPIKLPMHGAADSLNVSAAAAVLFYEALRQGDL
jgi:TrmH family RNA methyltransferase